MAKQLTVKQRNISIRSQYVTHRMTCAAIGQKWKLSTTRINQILHSMGVEMRPKNCNRWV